MLVMLVMVAMLLMSLHIQTATHYTMARGTDQRQQETHCVLRADEEQRISGDRTRVPRSTSLEILVQLTGELVDASLTSLRYRNTKVVICVANVATADVTTVDGSIRRRPGDCIVVEGGCWTT